MKKFLRYSSQFDQLTAAEKHLLDEDVQLIEKAVNVSHRLNKRKIATRNAHAKAFGFVRGNFYPVKNKEVNFAEYFGGENLGVILRFSHPNFFITKNGGEFPLYGCGLKIYNKNSPISAKFPLVNLPVFVTNSVSKFLKIHIKANQFFIATAKFSPFGVFKIPGLMKAGFSIFFDSQIFSILRNIKKVFSIERKFIGAYYYHSVGCFRLDQRIVKIRLKPQFNDEFKNSSKNQKENLNHFFTNQSLTFDFQVQFATDEKKTPVNNLLKNWKEKHSKMITVGKIVLPKQNISQYETMDYENLSFNPFENIEALQPVGRMQKIRQDIYSKSVETRKTLNQKK